MNRCPQCGSEKVFEGRHFNVLSGIPPQYFRPKDLKILTTGSADVRIKQTTYTACAECGLLWTQIDPRRLREVLVESGSKTVRQKLGET